MSEHRDSARYILATASATCALIVLDTNVVAVSLPSIARTFQASFADVEWVVSAYMVAFASCLLPAGGLADRFGRKRMLLPCSSWRRLAVASRHRRRCSISPALRRALVRRCCLPLHSR
jgi:MFS family permease